jgi:hypothetical protein
MPTLPYTIATPLAYPLDFSLPVPAASICFEEQQFVMSPPVLSTLETQILTAQPYQYTELFRSTLVQNCTSSTWNVSIARTVLFFTNSTSISNVLNYFYPGLHPNTGILCARNRTTVVDAALSGLYPLFPDMISEIASRGMPQPHLALLSQYIQPESPVYRVSAVSNAIVLASILTLQGL